MRKESSISLLCFFPQVLEIYTSAFTDLLFKHYSPFLKIQHKPWLLWKLSLNEDNIWANDTWTILSHFLLPFYAYTCKCKGIHIHSRMAHLNQTLWTQRVVVVGFNIKVRPVVFFRIYKRKTQITTSWSVELQIGITKSIYWAGM